MVLALSSFVDIPNLKNNYNYAFHNFHTYIKPTDNIFPGLVLQLTTYHYKIVRHYDNLYSNQPYL